MRDVSLVRVRPALGPRPRTGRVRLLAAGLGATVLLGGCGEAGGSAAPAPSEGAPTSAAAASFPVTIDHTYGETTIGTEPQRVVSVGFTDQDTLLALGVTPVAVRDWYGEQPYAVWPWAQEALGDATPEVLPSAALNYEAIAALAPDLIVGVSSGMTDEEYDLLSEIAPTVAQRGDVVDYGMPWQDQVRLVGAAVGRTGEADRLVTDTEELFEQAWADHPEFEGLSAAVAFTFDGSPGAYASQDSRARVLSDLGFVTPPAYDEIAGDLFYASFSGEQVDLLDTDVVVWLAGTDTERQAIQALPLREGLDAVAEGREVFAGQVLGGAFSFASPLSLPYLLDELVPELALAADGDAATPVPSAQLAS